MSVISYFVVYVFLKTKILKKKCFSSNTKRLHLHVLGPIQSSVASINFLKKKNTVGKEGFAAVSMLSLHRFPALPDLC